MSRRRALLAGALALGSCVDPVAQVVLAIRSDIPQGTTLRAVRLVARRRGAAAPFVDRRYELATARLPGDVAITAADPDDPRPLEVELTADLASPGREDFTHRLVTRFERNAVLFVEVFLSDACRDVTVRDRCAMNNLTCGSANGGCSPVERPGVAAPPTLDAGPAAPTCTPYRADTAPMSLPRCEIRLDDAMERCGDGVDNDCDGVTDEGCCSRSCEGASVDLRRHCDEVALAGGALTLGEAPGETPGVGREVSGVTVSPYRVDAYEVTVARFRRFVAAGMPAPPAGAVMFPRGDRLAMGNGAPWPTTTPRADDGSNFCNWTPQPGGWESDPINCVDWYTAMAFCVWDGGRLPTEAEWEYAARFRPLRDDSGNEVPAGRRYPWGNSAPTCDDANVFGLDTGYPRMTRPVGSRCNNRGSAPRSLQVYDLVGNVAEFVSDEGRSYTESCWRDAAAGFSARDPLCVTASLDDLRLIVHRGGSFATRDGAEAAAVRAAARGGFSPGPRSVDRSQGFRCVRLR